MHDSTAQSIAQPDKSSAGPSTEVGENQLSWHFGAAGYLDTFDFSDPSVLRVPAFML